MDKRGGILQKTSEPQPLTAYFDQSCVGPEWANFHHTTVGFSGQVPNQAQVREDGQTYAEKAETEQSIVF